MRSGTGIIAAFILICAINTPVRAAVIRVDFQPNAPFSVGPPINFTGVDSKAAAASAVFGSDGVNTWNYLTANVSNGGNNPTVPSVNPSFAGLRDSTGAPTSVGLSFTGNLLGADDQPINSTGLNPLENDYFFINANSSSASASYVLSGLPHNTPVMLFLYVPNFTNKGNRGYTLTANGNTITVPSGASNDALATVTSDANGAISGMWSTSGNEGDWSGFQLATPEPASLALLILAGGLALGRRRKGPH